MKNIISLSLLLVSTLISEAQDQIIQKNFSNIKAVELNTASGSITVKKSSGSEVSLTLRYSYDKADFTPEIEARNGTLYLKEEFSRGSHSGNSEWNLTVPDNTTLNMNTGSGNISLDGITTQVKSSLGSGDVEITGVKGKVQFNTGSGNIRLTNSEGDLSFNTGSGEIEASGGTGKYSLNSGSGDIDVRNMKGTLALNTGSGNITANAVTLEDFSHFNTGSGDATVTLKAALTHDINVNSGSGDATLNFNGTPIEGEVIMTANERNGNIVAPFKFDKEETVEERNSSSRIRKTARLGNKDITIKVGTGSGTARIAK
jgi:hypothetical protein